MTILHTTMTNPKYLVQIMYPALGEIMLSGYYYEEMAELSIKANGDNAIALWRIKYKTHAQPSRLAVNSNGNLQTTNTLD